MTKAPSKHFFFVFQRAQESIRGKYDLLNFFKRLGNFNKLGFPENFLSKLFRMLLNAFLNVMGNFAEIIKQFLGIPS